MGYIWFSSVDLGCKLTLSGSNQSQEIQTFSNNFGWTLNSLGGLEKGTEIDFFTLWSCSPSRSHNSLWNEITWHLLWRDFLLCLLSRNFVFTRIFSMFWISQIYLSTSQILEPRYLLNGGTQKPSIWPVIWNLQNSHFTSIKYHFMFICDLPYID